jgi:hypothetical protein
MVPLVSWCADVGQDAQSGALLDVWAAVRPERFVALLTIGGPGRRSVVTGHHQRQLTNGPVDHHELVKAVAADDIAKRDPVSPRGVVVVVAIDIAETRYGPGIESVSE